MHSASLENMRPSSLVPPRSPGTLLPAQSLLRISNFRGWSQLHGLTWMGNTGLLDEMKKWAPDMALPGQSMLTRSFDRV